MALLTSTITRSTIYPLLQYNSKPFLSSSLSPAKASLSLGRSSHITHARRGISSRTRRLEKGRKGAVVSPEEEQEEVVGDVGEGAAVEDPGAYVSADGVPMPELPGVETDFWEGPQWNAFGFFIQYLWAFGIIFGVIFPSYDFSLFYLNWIQGSFLYVWKSYIDCLGFLFAA